MDGGHSATDTLVAGLIARVGGVGGCVCSLSAKRHACCHDRSRNAAGTLSKTLVAEDWGCVSVSTLQMGHGWLRRASNTAVHVWLWDQTICESRDHQQYSPINEQACQQPGHLMLLTLWQFDSDRVSDTDQELLQRRVTQVTNPCRAFGARVHDRATGRRAREIFELHES